VTVDDGKFSVLIHFEEWEGSIKVDKDDWISQQNFPYEITFPSEGVRMSLKDDEKLKGSVGSDDNNEV
jgi:hypothetical protein